MVSMPGIMKILCKKEGSLFVLLVSIAVICCCCYLLSNPDTIIVEIRRIPQDHFDALDCDTKYDER
jgi:hypothetical protein